jgi:hypothetical protein
MHAAECIASESECLAHTERARRQSQHTCSKEARRVKVNLPCQHSRWPWQRAGAASKHTEASRCHAKAKHPCTKETLRGSRL